VSAASLLRGLRCPAAGLFLELVLPDAVIFGDSPMTGPVHTLLDTVLCA